MVKAKEEKKEEKVMGDPAAQSAEAGQTVSEKRPSRTPTGEIVAAIEKLTVLELADLVKALEEKFGVSAQMPLAALSAGAAGGGAQAPEAKEEAPALVSVILTAVGEKKLQVIKEVRAITSLGLKEAKDLVEGAPKPVKEGITKEEAEKFKKQIEAVGAKVDIK